ncbi:MAG: sensor histidine kinase [Vicinamibacterales bacterium]|nr:sensor histidine kinase [Vicinamibacterales bacterium]
MRSLRVLVAGMLATAAVVPLLVYGVVSVYTLRVGIRSTVVDGNTNVARQVGEQVRRYIATNLQIFQAVAVDLEGTGLTVDQQDRILKSFVLRFPEFRELTFYAADGRQQASSRVGAASARPDAAATRLVMGVTMTPVTVDDDLMPATIVTKEIRDQGVLEGTLVGQFSIEELWRMVDRIHVGRYGVALIVGAGGELLAHGNPDERPRVARSERLTRHPAVVRIREAGNDNPVVVDVTAADGGTLLSVGARIPELDWVVLVEQPYSEAFALARRQERELTAVISLALLVMVVGGFYWARTLITPIEALTQATQALAGGHLEQRVQVNAGGELGQLGTAFNSMADRLVTLQDDVRKQERHAMFGRVAAGLVHDLSHPFKNVHNNCKLILKMYADPEYRELFSRTVEREFSTIRRVFEDLRNIAKPMPLEKFPLDLNKLVGETAEAMRANADVASLEYSTSIGTAETYVAGDMFAIGRVCRNLIVNAIEATPPQGRVTVATVLSEGHARIVVTDTGCGIAPERIETLFEDFSTTKRQGLGLGLAISRKIVEQLGGTIAVVSEPGAGTAFTVAFPAVERPRTSRDIPADGVGA